MVRDSTFAENFELLAFYDAENVTMKLGYCVI